MKVPEHIVLVIVVMLVGKVCGYSEKSIMDLVKYIISFGILVKAKFIIKKLKDIKEFTLTLFTKN